MNTMTKNLLISACIIQGQSNAVGYNYENTTKRQDLTHTSSPWIRRSLKCLPPSMT